MPKYYFFFFFPPETSLKDFGWNEINPSGYALRNWFLLLLLLLDVCFNLTRNVLSLGQKSLEDGRGSKFVLDLLFPPNYSYWNVMTYQWLKKGQYKFIFLLSYTLKVYRNILILKNFACWGSLFSFPRFLMLDLLPNFLILSHF